MEEHDAYRVQFLTAKFEYERRIEPPAVTSPVPRELPPVTRVVGDNVQENRKSVHLPPIELGKFGGNVREWLQFWGRFKKIHENKKIDNEDKFQYLLQSMITGSRAENLVKSYPPSGENYLKVLDSLKRRFGREDLLIEVYVRELLQLVLHNAISPKKVQLVDLYDQLESHLRSLETLGLTTDKCGAMIFPLVESSLPEELLRAWQRSSNISEFNVNSDADSEVASDISKNRLTQLVKFLEAEVQNEQRIAMAKQGFMVKGSEIEPLRKPKGQPSEKDIPSARNLLSSRAKEAPCIFCEKTDHGSAQCEKAYKLTLSERQEIVKRKRACFKCMKIGHGSKFCRVSIKCSRCSRHHADLMCFGADNKNKSEERPLNSVSGVSIQEECCLVTSYGRPCTYMQTLKVKLRNDKKEIIVRAVIDTGSQNSYILKAVAEQMYEPISKQNVVHLLFGGNKSAITAHNKYLVRAGNIHGDYWCNFETMDETIICSDVPSITQGPWLRELKDMGINLSDVDSKENSVSLLIGADIAGKLFTGRVRALKSGLTAMETYLGWTLMGKVPTTEREDNLAVSAIAMFSKTADIQDLWDLDVLGIKDPIDHKTQKQHDMAVKEAFQGSVIKNSENRYEVRLPWLECHPVLKENKSMAMQRLESTVKKLHAAGKYIEYDSIFQEWLKDGIIERVPPEDELRWGNYLPHRPVYKDNSTTTTRPIYDASAGQPSLNSCLEKGPNLIELVTDILLRFREGRIGVIADIRKAFLQISVSPTDRDFLRFLWLDEEEKIVTYRHCRVVFGVRSSPFILGSIIDLHLSRTLESLHENAIYNTVCKNTERLKRSFYVDNCVASMNSVTELKTFINNAKTVMESGKFDLRGWEYTNDGVAGAPTNVLGLLWHKESDSLSINICSLENLELGKITKRVILSAAHRIFDPLGFVCPVALGPKILLQEAWGAKLSWDEEVSENIRQRFAHWVQELKNLEKIKVPRCMIGEIDEKTEVSLHTFVDASQLAYAVVIFIRIQRGSEVNVQFVQAKTRVAPVSKKEENSRNSIPRLELLAATIGARLSKQVLAALDLKSVKSYYWSDSSTVITWIKRENNWSIFVANRVKEIRSITESKHWQHVPGHLNPADLPSRGCSVDQLLASRWWEGPQWLKENAENWPTDTVVDIDEIEVNAELKKSDQLKNIAMINVKKTVVKDELFSNISYFSSVVRSIGWIWRFKTNCYNRAQARKDQARTGIISKERINTEQFLVVAEIQKAEIILLKYIQNRHFKGLKDEGIRDFLPFYDQKGLIRTKSKLLYREDNFNFKCPIILPDKEELVKLLIRKIHVEFNHAGVGMTLNALREKYWVIRGRKSVRTIIDKCVECRRHDAKKVTVQSSPLPLERVRDAAIFEVIGVDFAGPVHLKGGQKAWICMFTCAVFRAINLELVGSLNVPSFLMALRRHISKLGRPSTIFCDNGTNFVGLSNRLKGINYRKIAKTLALQEIEWRFSPPSAPWWGGFWERLIGLLKRLLRRTLRKSCLNYEEMLTTLTDCQAIINSRPITYLSDSHEEMMPLTPSMFLLEQKEIGVLDLDKVEATDVGKRYAYRVKIKNALRQRFRVEYLGALSHLKSKNKAFKDLQVGDLVLIGNDLSKRIDWPLAVIKELYAGKDGHTRVARLTTATGEITRPVQRLYPLELNTVCESKKETSKTPREKCIPVNLMKAFKTRSGRISRNPDRLMYN